MIKETVTGGEHIIFFAFIGIWILTIIVIGIMEAMRRK